MPITIPFVVHGGGAVPRKNGGQSHPLCLKSPQSLHFRISPPTVMGAPKMMSRFPPTCARGGRRKVLLPKAGKSHFSGAPHRVNKLQHLEKQPGIFEKLIHIGKYHIGKYHIGKETLHEGEEKDALRTKLTNKQSVNHYAESIKADYNRLKKELANGKEKYIKGRYQEYLFDCIQNNDHSNLIIADVIYEKEKKILCVGEGNLSFSTLLQRKLRQSQVVATSQESPNVLLKSCGGIFSKNLKMLESCGGIYVPEVHVEKIGEHFPHNTFDVIIFNFPFVLPSDEFIQTKWNLQREKLHSDRNIFLKYYKKAEYFLLNRIFYWLFKNGSFLLKESGFLHLRVNDRYLTCDFANTFSLSLVEKVDFSSSYFVYKSLGYVPSMMNACGNSSKGPPGWTKNVMFTPRGKVFRSFKMGHTSTLVFQKGGGVEAKVAVDSGG
ncbi:conserved Plasmodium protein, unknown function [Plasmodium vivax]|uniref:25S rRNA (uridine-N(3))-methyltransferase BMT5-like domain-containing protein n=3 Tax=Plasmodium vivax TaxID=5855 RepID=A0A0J9TG89_PLAVI|nr:hypothetical protein PVBG_02641 [Plasmodium vivax Brazil I]KMZ94555.1 hypothetical protein PVMG_01912 [Plasmodium vivax Mauritania I]SCO71373.1 conserved Plasmodium protein, unknown function [Plasmodium vivax]